MTKERCKETVWSNSAFHSHQCSRYAVRDGYCKQHHPDSVKERAQKSKERYEKELENSPYSKLNRAEKKITELEIKLELYKTLLPTIKDALIYYSNARHQFASAIAQKDYKTREGRKPTIEQVHNAIEYAKLCDKVLGCVNRIIAEENNGDESC